MVRDWAGWKGDVRGHWSPCDVGLEVWAGGMGGF